MCTMTTTEPATKHTMAIGINGRVTTTFDKIAIGQKCRVMLSGKDQVVVKLDTQWWGPRVTNARKCEGRKGLAFVGWDRVVEVVE